MYKLINKYIFKNICLTMYFSIQLSLFYFNETDQKKIYDEQPMIFFYNKIIRNFLYNSTQSLIHRLCIIFFFNNFAHKLL